RWKSPPIEAYFASYLDSQFKNLSFAKMIETIANAVNTPVQTEIDQLYDGVQLDFPVENELK
ncbi:8655_t:CDS:2, partial [Scutellospora calospora]